MLSFKINEIQKGKSTERVVIPNGGLDLSGVEFKGLELDVAFERREFAILVSFEFNGEVKLTCDRSLDEYWQPLSGSYSILFKEGAEEESEDAQMSVRRLDISGNIINIEDEVRDTILLSIPLRKIHPRYYDENGELIDLEVHSEEEPTMDPRWDALKKLKETNQ